MIVWTSMTGGNRGLEPAAVRGHCSHDQAALTKTLTLPIMTYSIFNNISGDHLQSHSVNNIALKSVNSDWSIKHCNIVWFTANCRIRQKFNNGSKWQIISFSLKGLYSFKTFCWVKIHGLCEIRKQLHCLWSSTFGEKGSRYNNNHSYFRYILRSEHIMLFVKQKGIHLQNHAIIFPSGIP